MLSLGGLPLASLAFPALYVIPFYLWQTKLPRNHPTTVKRRMLISSVLCISFAWLPTYRALHAATPLGESIPLGDVLVALGLRRTGLFAALTLPLLLTAILFAGPLVMAHHSSTLFRPELMSLLGFRNLVAAPLTEELFFRSGLISLLLASGVSPARCVWLSPLLFAMAHVHHVVDLIVYQGNSLQTAVASCLLQVGYTTLFGWFAAFLMLRTGHFAALALTHSFCNYMGLPRFGAISSSPKATQIKLAFVGGIAGYAALLFPLTTPQLYGYPKGLSYLDHYNA